MVGVGFLQSLWEKPIWEGVWPYLDPTDSVCLCTASMEWNVPGKYGPHDVLKKCALIALHEIADEGRDGDGCHVPGLGDEWKIGCPKESNVGE